ncbi:MAG: peptidase [Sphingomonas bacterium]|nr:A24 family peptidase [Sphingomonas bacterium]MDB5688939.1 peptidase [Sphingomonas bacterium]
MVSLDPHGADPVFHALWVLLGGLAGAIVGSFLATLVLRWPAGTGLGGRSRCDGCGRAIGAAALVPLLSYLVLRGRCRACGDSIDRRHPAIELGAAAIGAVALAIAPGPAGAAGAVFGWLLLTLAILDLEHFWLPDRLTGTLAAAGLCAGLAGVAPPLATRIIGGLVGFAALAGIGFLYARLRGRVGLGQGDPKLLGAIGLWLGWPALPLVLLGASLIGLGAVAALRLTGRRIRATDRLPLGTLMAAASWLLWCATTRGNVIIPA